MEIVKLEIEGINKKNWEVYSRYLTSKAINNKDTLNTTYKSYYNNMKLFFRYLKKYEHNRYIFSVETLKNFVEIWERYTLYCLTKGNNNQTIRNKRVAVSTFMDWAEKRDIIKYNPFHKIENIKVTQADKVRKSYFLSMQQVWEINYVMRKEVKKFDIQDRLLFNLFLDSAVRISAGHSLKLSQLDLQNNYFAGVRHKEGYIKPVLFFQETRKILLEWIQEREKKGIDLDFLFVTRYNGKYKQMTKGTIRARIKKIGRIVGIENYYPHSIRKTAINLISGAGTLADGSMLAYHKSQQVTAEHYIKEKEEREVRLRLLQLRQKIGLN